MLDTEVIAVLRYLLPGFVAASLYYAFTSHTKPSPFERVVQALVFTVVVEAAVGVGGAFGLPHADSVAVAVAMAATMGIVVAAAVNHDLVHRAFRWLRLTRETSHPTDWYSAFAGQSDRYLVLHLVGERRLYGWAPAWPSSPDQGHFKVLQGEWLIGDQRQPAGQAIIVRVQDVEMVEFVERNLEDGRRN